MRAPAVTGLLGAAVAACGNGGTKAATTTLALDVRDGAGHPIGARVLLHATDGAAVRLGSLDLYGNRQSKTACEYAPGVLGTWDGFVLAYGAGDVPVIDADCGVPPGQYHVSAWRGIEYERWEGDVDLAANLGRVPLRITLDRAWTPTGTLAADLHVHAAASPDSGVPNPQRVAAEVAAGVQVIGLSDHDHDGDVGSDIHALHLDEVAAAIPSIEMTSDALHMNVYPVPVVPGAPHGGAQIPDDLSRLGVAKMFALAHAFPGDPIVQVNHPRYRVTALFDGTRWDGHAWPPPFPLTFDAMEVLNGYSAANAPGDRRIDECVRDYYTLVDHGHLVAPMGNSDVHNFNWVHEAIARTYVFVTDARVRPFDQRGFVDAIRHSRIEATTGPWLDVAISARQGGPAVGPGQAIVPVDGQLWVDVTVSQTKFVRADQLRVTLGGNSPIVVAVPPGQRSFHWARAIAVGSADTWLGVDAGGDAPLPAEQTGNYQQDKWHRPGTTPFAIVGAILIDADGDGRWKRGDADVPLK